MEQVVAFSFPPQRIVSLVPSQTEFLHTLGLDDRVVAITKFCVHPESWRHSKVIIGGTKQFSIEKIHALQPDLVIGNKEENYPEGIAELKKHYPVWMSDIFTVEDALDMMKRVGDLTGTSENADLIIQNIQNAFLEFPITKPRRCVYLIWRDPYMVAGASTFIHDILSRIGLMNVCGQARYPVVTQEQLKYLDPELIMLSSEPYPFKQDHVEEIRKLLPDADIRLVDGEMFSWYGSRMTEAPNYFRSLNL